jgi:hypothetical protein
MPSGGFRPGAGRKPRAVKYARPIAAAEKQIADRLGKRDGLPGLIDNLLQLADGGYEQVTQHYEAAGSITIGQGEAQQLVYPDKKPDELVLVKTVRTLAAPDLKANTYLVDRILGKPTAELEVSGPDGGPIEMEDRGLSDEARAERIAGLLERIRARAAGPAAAAEADLGPTPGSAD